MNVFEEPSEEPLNKKSGGEITQKIWRKRVHELERERDSLKKRLTESTLLCSEATKLNMELQREILQNFFAIHGKFCLVAFD